MSDIMRVHGHVEPGFEPVRATFRANFRRGGETGAAFCAYKDGRMVANLWAGVADVASGRAWEEDTLCVIVSATKGLAATCCLMLAERGELDYDAPIADYWPGFERASKAQITARQLMNHRSGLCAFDTPLTIDDFSRGKPVVAAMEAQRPLWEPGAAQGYHGVTYGPFVAELVRRVSGRSIGTFLAEEVAGPLGADAFIGLPDALDGRMATIYPVTVRQRLLKALPYVVFNNTVERRLLKALVDKQSTTFRAFSSPAELGVKGVPNFNLPKVRRLELPWANGIASARGLAAVYNGLITGQLCDAAALEPIKARQSYADRDRVLQKEMGWSQGFIKEEQHMFSPHTEAFGHPGLGGALGFCDPDRGLAWGYTMNKLDFRLRSPRAIRLSRALYDCVPNT